MLLWLLWLLWLPLAAVLLFLYRRPYLLQDARFFLTRLRLTRTFLDYNQRNFTVLDRFLETVESRPNKAFLRFVDQTFTYRDADELSSRAARVLLQSGRVREGDTVALFLRNEPMFLWLWLGLVKIGCSAALLNCNIRSRSLLHCFDRSGARTLVVGEDLQDAVMEVLPTLLEQQVMVFALTDSSQTPSLHSFMDKMSLVSSEPLPRAHRSQLTLQSPAVYVYTSGTTGLPKAAPISHGKLWRMSFFHLQVGVRSDDVIYITLPLYHSAGFIGVTGSIQRGITVVLRSKFSASQFWDDCRKYDVTVIQYIGEIMRYLCSTPKKPNDRSHRVRLALGNGIRPDVWREFLQRFGNIQIKEFYGATEGNMVLINYVGRIGAVGRAGFLCRMSSPHVVIRFDVDKGEPVRDSSGLCIEVARGEPGLLVSEISARTPFSGYAGDLEQTEKKKLHDVLRKGDVYFNTGDLMLLDEEDFIYFHDRVGDTFRWKGENVATTEVAGVLTLVDCISEANVYGVRVPGHEGRAGMAAVTVTAGQTFNSASIFSHVRSFLPSYARPRFFRIQGSLEVTGTFKHLKGKLVEDGFDPDVVKDPVYFLDEEQKDYVPLTADVFRAIASGRIKI